MSPVVTESGKIADAATASAAGEAVATPGDASLPAPSRAAIFVGRLNDALARPLAQCTAELRDRHADALGRREHADAAPRGSAPSRSRARELHRGEHGQMWWIRCAARWRRSIPARAFTSCTKTPGTSWSQSGHRRRQAAALTGRARCWRSFVPSTRSTAEYRRHLALVLSALESALTQWVACVLRVATLHSTDAPGLPASLESAVRGAAETDAGAAAPSIAVPHRRRTRAPCCGGGAGARRGARACGASVDGDGARTRGRGSDAARCGGRDLQPALALVASAQVARGGGRRALACVVSRGHGQARRLLRAAGLSGGIARHPHAHVGRRRRGAAGTARSRPWRHHDGAAGHARRGGNGARAPAGPARPLWAVSTARQLARPLRRLRALRADRRARLCTHRQARGPDRGACIDGHRWARGGSAARVRGASHERSAPAALAPPVTGARGDSAARLRWQLRCTPGRRNGTARRRDRRDRGQRRRASHRAEFQPGRRARGAARRHSPGARCTRGLWRRIDDGGRARPERLDAFARSGGAGARATAGAGHVADRAVVGGARTRLGERPSPSWTATAARPFRNVVPG